MSYTFHFIAGDCNRPGAKAPPPRPVTAKSAPGSAIVPSNTGPVRPPGTSVSMSASAGPPRPPLPATAALMDQNMLTPLIMAQIIHSAWNSIEAAQTESLEGNGSACNKHCAPDVFATSTPRCGWSTRTHMSSLGLLGLRMLCRRNRSRRGQTAIPAAPTALLPQGGRDQPSADVFPLCGQNSLLRCMRHFILRWKQLFFMFRGAIFVVKCLLSFCFAFS